MTSGKIFTTKDTKDTKDTKEEYGRPSS